VRKEAPQPTSALPPRRRDTGRVPRTPGEGLIRAGGAVFLIGLLALLVVVVPFFFGERDRPLALNLLAGAGLPLGLGLALAGLVRGARARARPGQR
jgi:hypothetical protein